MSSLPRSSPLPRPAPPAGTAWPVHPISWEVPGVAGDAAELTARALAGALGARLGQPVIVEPRGGCALAGAPADGHVLLTLRTGPRSAAPGAHGDDPLHGVVPVHGLLQSAPLLAVPHASPYATLPALLEAARRRPGQLTVGVAGPVTPAQLAAAVLRHEAGVRWQEVPYKGSTAALQDLQGGRLDAVVDTMLPLRAALQAGRLRALAVLGRRRIAALPGVPTIAEAGWPVADGTHASGLAVPQGTPAEVVRRLAAAVRDVLADAEVMSPLLASGELPLLEPGEAPWRALVLAEQRRWATLAARLAPAEPAEPGEPAERPPGGPPA